MGSAGAGSGKGLRDALDGIKEIGLRSRIVAIKTLLKRTGRSKDSALNVFLQPGLCKDATHRKVLVFELDCSRRRKRAEMTNATPTNKASAIITSAKVSPRLSRNRRPDSENAEPKG